MYCDISKDKVVISLQSGQYLCQRYVRLVESVMKSTYKDMVQMQKYIDEKQDAGYWIPLKEQKSIWLNQLQTHRLLILSRMQEFEHNVFVKSKEYFLENISSYSWRLNYALSAMQDLSPQTATVKKYTDLIQENLDVLDKIRGSQDFSGMNIYIQRFVSLKQQLI